jgi:hypothetical protein
MPNMEDMTNNPQIHPTPVDLTLNRLDDAGALFVGYLRMEAPDAGAEGFGIEGATRIERRLDRDSWEGAGSPVVLAVTLRNVR